MITPEGYAHMTRMLMGLACGKIAMVLEVKLIIYMIM